MIIKTKTKYRALLITLAISMTIPTITNTFLKPLFYLSTISPFGLYFAADTIKKVAELPTRKFAGAVSATGFWWSLLRRKTGSILEATLGTMGTYATIGCGMRYGPSIMSYCKKNPKIGIGIGSLLSTLALCKIAHATYHHCSSTIRQTIDQVSKHCQNNKEAQLRKKTEALKEDSLPGTTVANPTPSAPPLYPSMENDNN